MKALIALQEAPPAAQGPHTTRARRPSLACPQGGGRSGFTPRGQVPRSSTAGRPSSQGGTPPWRLIRRRRSRRIPRRRRSTTRRRARRSQGWGRGLGLGRSRTTRRPPARRGRARARGRVWHRVRVWRRARGCRARSRWRRRRWRRRSRCARRPLFTAHAGAATTPARPQLETLTLPCYAPQAPHRKQARV